MQFTGLLEVFDRTGSIENLLARNRTRPVDQHRALARVQHCGLNTVRSWTRIEHCVNSAVQIVQHMLGGSGADVAEHVGAGCGYRHTCSPDECQRHRVRRHTQSYQRSTRRYHVGHCAGSRKQQSQRPRPEFLYQLRSRIGHLLNQAVQHPFIGDVDDYRIPGRSLFGHKYPSHCSLVESIRSQSVHSLSGQRHQASAAQDLGRPIKRIQCIGCIKIGGING